MQERLLADSQAPGSLVCSWFYSARDNLVLHGQMFKALLYQLLSQDSALFQAMKDIYRSGLKDENDPSARRWLTVEISSALEALFNCSALQERPCLLVLDGVDESNTNDVGEDSSRPEALKFLVRLTTNSPLLKAIFLSRPSDDIRRVLKHQLFISMHTVNRPDIIFLIDKGIDTLARQLDGYDSDDDYSPAKTSFSRRSSSSSRVASIPLEYFQRASDEKKAMLSEIDNYLRKNARGVVLWVTMALDVLQRKCRDEPFCDITSLTLHLENLPLELSELYAQITIKLIESFKDDHRILLKARRALMWVSASSNYTMQLQDLLEVVSYDFSSGDATIKRAVFAGLVGWTSLKREIESLCGPFIEVIPILPRSDIIQAPEATQWDSLQLPHESVRMFLQQSKGSLALGFSAAEAEKVVREERKAYMQRTLPYLEPLLWSRTRDVHKLQHYCEYFESRPLLCFILTTMEFELQHIMSLEGGKDCIANILNAKTSPTGSKYSRISSFMSAGRLLAAMDFFKPDWTETDETTEIRNAHDNDNLEKLFFNACRGGMLNAVNALSSLLVSPTGLQKWSIIIGILGAADDVKMESYTEILKCLVPALDRISVDDDDQLHCSFSEILSPLDKSVRVEAAISQVIDHGILQGAAVGLWTTLAQLQIDLMLQSEIESYQLRSLGLKKDNRTASYLRSPFTHLRIVKATEVERLASR